MYSTMWSETKLPDEMVNIIRKDLEQFDDMAQDGLVGDNNNSKKAIRESKIVWINENHWVSGFLMHFINIHNKTNYGYDLSGGIDGGTIQYSQYGPGNHYTWHTDVSGPDKALRKLSFTLQLSDEDEYEGGELQFITPTRESFTAPKAKGTLISFKSDMLHRVRPVKSGMRRSIVGWVTGPAWK